MSVQAVTTAVRHPPARRAGGRLWPLSLTVLAAAAAVLTVWGTWADSFVDYYAAAVISMSRSWSDFLFGAFDPAGTVSVDKIPGALWIPALLVRLFGFSAWALILPEAVAAVVTVVVVAVTARRLSGPAAGLVAGGVVATTPVLVAVARSNHPESLFVLTLALTAWAAVHALQRGSLRWLVVAGVFIAAGFQVYMLVAWAAWPALAAAYLCTRQRWRRRVGHLVIAGTVSVVLSLAWVIAVGAVPAADRPYVGSTVHDSPWEMVFGYNGLGRFGAMTADPSAYDSFTPRFAGAPGPLRLVDPQLAGQIAWLLPSAVLGVVVLLVVRSRRWLPVLLGGWLVTFAVMFSTVAGMHEFYTAALAVPTALAVGCAFGRARTARVRWPQPALVAVAAGSAVAVSTLYSAAAVRVAVVQAVIAAAAVTLLVMTSRCRSPGWTRTALGLSLAGLLLAPAAWSAATLRGVSAGDPVAGGALAARAAPAAPTASVVPTLGGTAPPAGWMHTLSPAGDAALMAYARTHDRGARYPVAVFGAMWAAPLIVDSRGGSVLPIGGYSGTDPAPTLEAFTAMVQAGDVHDVLMPTAWSGVSDGTGTSQAQSIFLWVGLHCAATARAPVPNLYTCRRG